MRHDAQNPIQTGLAPFSCATPEDVADSSDALVLVTEWPHNLEMDWGKLAGLMRTPLILDGRHVLDSARLTRAGFRYLALAGWNPSAVDAGMAVSK